MLNIKKQSLHSLKVSGWSHHETIGTRSHTIGAHRSKEFEIDSPWSIMSKSKGNAGENIWKKKHFRSIVQPDITLYITMPSLLLAFFTSTYNIYLHVNRFQKFIWILGPRLGSLQYESHQNSSCNTTVNQVKKIGRHLHIKTPKYN
jgi:hypothetical protein